MAKRLVFAATALLAVVLFGGVAVAQNAAGPASAQSVAQLLDTFNTPQEKSDQAAVVSAISAMNTGGYPALRSHLSDLRAVLDHAPSAYPVTERRGSIIVIRAGSSAEYAVLASRAASQSSSGGGGPVNIVNGMNVYPMAATILAGSAVEDRQPDQAIAFADRMLSLQPENVDLLVQKAEAQELKKDFPTSLATYQAGLNVELVSNDQKGVLLRGKGSALVEMGRLDEGEQAYRDSLKAAPNNALANNELSYIAHLRAGGSPTPLVIVKPGETPSATSEQVGSPAPMVTPSPAAFDRADANHDGKLDKAEFRTTARAQPPNDADAAWRNADKDGDGFISRDEFVAPIPAPIGAIVR